MYELTQLFWYRPIFMTELLLGEFLFTFRLKKRSLYLLRLFFMVVICYGISFAFPIISYNSFFCSFMFLALFIVTVLTLKICYNESFINIIFCAIAGYTLQHMAYEIYNFIVDVSNLSDGFSLGMYGSNTGIIYAPFASPITALIYSFDYIITYWLIFMLFGNKIKRKENLRLKNTNMLLLVCLVVVIDIVLSSFITYYAYDKFDKFYMIMLCLFNILCCILTMTIQFELPLRKKLENELEVLNQLRYQEKEQYSISKENMELINLKCHDLKYQIRRIGMESSVNSDAIKEMENVISIYDSKVKTGNQTLDIILTEKSLLCNKNHIKLTCIVDGKRLDFMKETDLYSVFGNALDNAIEAVRTLEEDKRVIGVTVKMKKEFLSINVHNYFNQELSFEYGLPQTTKEDKEYHGYGMKSIRQICEKYNGDLSIQAENHIFNLNILFPLNTDTK